MTDLLPLWENLVLRLATFAIAAGVLWRYGVAPLARAVRRGWQLGRQAADKLDQINAIIDRELTPNHGTALVDKVDTIATSMQDVKQDQQRLAASMVKYAWDHAQDHTGLHRWLAEVYGVDRRDEDDSDTES